MNSTVDVVIPFRNSPFTNNIELRYALRSIDMYLQNVGKVFIIGDDPGIKYQNVELIPHLESDWNKYLTRNIHEKLVVASTSIFISDTFLYMNDDHFLLQAMDAVNCPYFCTGEWGGTGKYSLTIQSTKSAIGTDNVLNFDVHAPMLINSFKYLQTVAALDWRRPYGYCIKTMYVYLNNIPGYGLADLKINDSSDMTKVRKQIKGCPVFSVGDKALTGVGGKAMLDLLHELYPHKSKYER